MTNKIPNLDSILPESLKGSLYRQVKDMFGTPITVHSVAFTKDDRGNKATIVATLIDSPDKFYVATRATQPLAVLSHISRNKLFPFNAKFAPQGQAVLLVDPDKVVDDNQPGEEPF